MDMSVQYPEWAPKDPMPITRSTAGKRTLNVPVAQIANEQTVEAEVDRCGQATLALIERAAEGVSSELQRVTDETEKLLLQVSDSENRNAQLEAEIRHFQDRASKAEKWLARITAEIENEFFKQGPAMGTKR
jgi:septal ring factor EnvC (AmiA/AmiB activator)